MSSVARLVFGIGRDLYVVLLAVAIAELFFIPGGDLLHDGTRKIVVGLSVCFVLAKVAGLTDKGPSGMWRTANRTKTTTSGTVQAMDWASVEMQGWRPAMEDAVRVVGSLPASLEQRALFAVFDGHGGEQVSKIAAAKFPDVLAECARGFCEAAGGEAVPQEGDGRPRAKAARAEADRQSEIAGKSLHQAMLRMDEELRKLGGSGSVAVRPPRGLAAERLELHERRNAFSLTGSTAIVVLVDYSEDDGRPKRLTVANCGDSRAVLCRNGEAVELSQDHKPELPAEEERIKGAGGHVALAGVCHRIDGWGLNLSRALGDFHYKSRADLPPEKQKVSCVPEVRFLELTGADEFLLLGCDGIFELHSSQAAVDVVRGALRAGGSVAGAAELLVDRSCSPDLMATRGKGGDNCSAIVVRLR